MVVGVATVRLFIRESRSLKSKRRIVRAIKNRLRQKFNVAVSEVGALDNWQIVELGVVTVSGGREVVDGTFRAMRGLLESHPEAALAGMDCEYL